MWFHGLIKCEGGNNHYFIEFLWTLASKLIAVCSYLQKQAKKYQHTNAQSDQ